MVFDLIDLPERVERKNEMTIQLTSDLIEV